MVVAERKPIALETANSVRSCNVCSAKNYIAPKAEIYELRVGSMVVAVCKDCAAELRKVLEEQNR